MVLLEARTLQWKLARPEVPQAAEAVPQLGPLPQQVPLRVEVTQQGKVMHSSLWLERLAV